VVEGLRGVYSQALSEALHRLLLGGLVWGSREEQGEAAKQVYHELRSTPLFSCLNSMIPFASNPLGAGP